MSVLAPVKQHLENLDVRTHDYRVHIEFQNQSSRRHVGFMHVTVPATDKPHAEKIGRRICDVIEEETFVKVTHMRAALMKHQMLLIMDEAIIEDRTRAGKDRAFRMVQKAGGTMFVPSSLSI